MVEKGWGYTKTESAEDLRASYSKLVISGPVPEGLAGVIYTQTTDVESEINGLLTYDRVYKIDPDVLRSFTPKYLISDSSRNEEYLPLDF